MKMTYEEFKDKIDDLLFTIQGLSSDIDVDQDPPEEYIHDWEVAIGHIFEAEGILENLLDELENIEFENEEEN